MRADFYTYVHFKPDGTPFYVGKGCKGRWKDMDQRSTWHKRVQAKYGIENLLVWVSPKSTEDEAFGLEAALIWCFRRMNLPLCNFTSGGEGASGTQVSAETREKLSRAGKARFASPEEKAKHKESLASDETRERMRSAAVQRMSDPEYKEKLRGKLKAKHDDPVWREAFLELMRSPERIAKLKARNHRVVWTEEMRAAQGARRKGPRQSAETIQKRAEKQKEAWADPEARARRIAAIKAARNTPESKARTAAASRAVAAKKKALRNEST